MVWLSNLTDWTLDSENVNMATADGLGRQGISINQVGDWESQILRNWKDSAFQ